MESTASQLFWSQTALTVKMLLKKYRRPAVANISQKLLAFSTPACSHQENLPTTPFPTYSNSSNARAATPRHRSVYTIRGSNLSGQHHKSKGCFKIKTEQFLISTKGFYSEEEQHSVNCVNLLIWESAFPAESRVCCSLFERGRIYLEQQKPTDMKAD